MIWWPAIAVGAIVFAVLWGVERIVHRITTEAEATRTAIEFLRQTLIDRLPKDAPYPGNQEIIEAVSEVERRVGDIAIGLGEWRKESTAKPISPASKFDLD
jgi:hypothetical protein